MTEEIWKDVYGYKGLYQVSNIGRVNSLARWNADGKVLLPTRILKKDNSKKTGTVTLYLNGKGKKYRVAKLVAEIFCQRPEGTSFILHKDWNYENDNSENLEWITRKKFYSLDSIRRSMTIQIVSVDGKKTIIGSASNLSDFFKANVSSFYPNKHKKTVKNSFFERRGFKVVSVD